MNSFSTKKNTTGKKGVRKLLLGTTLFTLVLIFQFRTLTAQSTFYEEEVRGVWITNVDSDVLTSKQKIADAMDYLADNGINVVFPVVWNKGYTQYPSQVMVDYFGESYRQDPAFSNSNRDPLQEIIVEAHRNGMEVVPWFEYGFAYLYSGTGSGPTGNSHIVETYPHWAAKDAGGDIVKKNGFEWLNAIHPEVQNFMLSLVQEVIANYDVDGVQGDDRMPAMASEGGYSEYTDSLYKAEHNGNAPPSSYNDSEFLQWKADKLTAFGEKLYELVKEEDEHLLVSLSPSIYDFSYRNYLQDWPTWLDSGYVDIIHPQAYRYSVSDYKSLIYEMVGTGPVSSSGYIPEKHHHKISPGILTKAGSRFNGPGYVLEAVDFNRQLDVNGEVYFFYEGMGSKNNYLADSLRAYEYEDPAIIPARNGNIRRPEASILNETDPEVERQGSWQIGNTPEGFEDRSLKAEDGSGASLTYVMEVPYSAHYHLATYVPGGDGATKSAYYEVRGMNDTSAVRIDQQKLHNHGWMELGDVYLEKGLHRVLTVHADSVEDGGTTYADAAMLLLNRKKSPDVTIEARTTDLPDLFDTENGARPDKHRLVGNYPNPFNPSTTIAFELASREIVSLSIYTVHGRKIATPVKQQSYAAGRHRVSFDGSGLASGVYLYRLSDRNGVIATQSMTLIK